MSAQPENVNRNDVLNIYQEDPQLGKYVSHYPSNRIRLIIIGGLLYTLPVGILQIIFLDQETDLVAIVLPIVFAAIAGAILWWILHHWNREVVLYEKGFSYRQGSVTAYILYANVVKLIANIERIGFLGLSRTVYDYHLTTDIEEELIINNIYSSPDKLTRSLETFIARDRMPLILQKLAGGEQVAFGENLHLSDDGIILNEDTLHWHDFMGQRVKNGQLTIQSHNNESWGIVPVTKIDNPVLLIALMRARRQMPETTT